MVFSCASCDCHEAAPPGPAGSSADVTVTPQPSSQILLEHSRPPACRQLEDAGGWRPGLEPGQPGTRARRKTEAPEETWAQSTEYLQAILWRGGRSLRLCSPEHTQEQARLRCRQLGSWIKARGLPSSGSEAGGRSESPGGFRKRDLARASPGPASGSHSRRKEGTESWLPTAAHTEAGPEAAPPESGESEPPSIQVEVTVPASLLCSRPFFPHLQGQQEGPLHLQSCWERVADWKLQVRPVLGPQDKAAPTPLLW